MAKELKTKATGEDVAGFLAKMPDDARREECIRLVALMKKASGGAPRMWGSSIIGFGETQLKYPNGRELDWFVCGLSPRKDALTLYGLLGASPATEKLLGKLGKHKTGKGCLYVKKLSDVDLDVLLELVQRAAGAKKKK